MKTLSMALMAWLALALSLPSAAHDIVRRSGSDLPIATSVKVADGAEWLLVGMTLPGITDAAAPADGAARLGDTAAQARSVLDQIAAELNAQGFAMSDVIRLTVYLVGDPARDGRPDYAGLMSAYLQHFGPDSGGLPVRSTVQVAGLPVPGALVAIDAIAARSGDHSHD